MRVSRLHRGLVGWFPNANALSRIARHLEAVLIVFMGLASPGSAEAPARFSEVLDVTIPAPVTSAA